MNILLIDYVLLNQKFVENKIPCVTSINRSFLMQVDGRLVGVVGLISSVGYSTFVKLVSRAFSSDKQIVCFNLRRGVTVKFYSK